MKPGLRHRDVQKCGCGMAGEGLKPRKVGEAGSLMARGAMLGVWWPLFYSGASGDWHDLICGLLLQEDRIR